LNSTPAFSRENNVEKFYNSMLSIFYDPDEQEEVGKLLDWWNLYACDPSTTCLADG